MAGFQTRTPDPVRDDRWNFNDTEKRLVAASVRSLLRLSRDRTDSAENLPSN